MVPPWQQARERPICVGPWSPLPAGMTRLRAALALKPRCNTVRIKSAVRRVSRSLDSNASQSLVETPTVPFNWLDRRSLLFDSMAHAPYRILGLSVKRANVSGFDAAPPNHPDFRATEDHSGQDGNAVAITQHFGLSVKPLREMPSTTCPSVRAACGKAAISGGT